MNTCHIAGVQTTCPKIDTNFENVYKIVEKKGVEQIYKKYWYKLQKYLKILKNVKFQNYIWNLNESTNMPSIRLVIHYMLISF